MDSIPKDWSSLGELRVPLDREMLEAAKRMYQDNRGALCTHLLATGLLVEDSIELRANLVSLFAQIDEIPISALDHAFAVNGREAWAIAQTEPIFMFWCLSCQEPIHSKGSNHMRRLKRELAMIRNCHVGEMMSTALLCGGCTEFRLQLHNEEQRLSRLAQQARTAQLRKMSFAEYWVQREWQARRTATLARAGYRCQTCGDTDVRLDIHHNTYERYGDESTFDLVALCDRCHELFHGIMQDAS